MTPREPSADKAPGGAEDPPPASTPSWLVPSGAPADDRPGSAGRGGSTGAGAGRGEGSRGVRGRAPRPTPPKQAAVRGGRPARPGPPAPPATGVASWWPWGAAGLVAALAGLGVAQIVAALTGGSSSPLIAVGDAAIDQVPPWLKDWATNNFGTHDKQVLLWGAAAVVAALAVLAGRLSRRAPSAAGWLIVGLGVVAAAAAATRPDGSVLSVAPSLCGAMVSVWVLSLLTPRLAQVDGLPRGDPRRRTVLQLLAVTGGAGVAALGGGQVLGARLGGADASRAAVVLPTPVEPDPALPAGVEVGVPGVVPYRVANADFYRIDTALIVPRVRSQDWKLRLHGMVDRELSLDFAELLAGRLVERDVTLCCVSNEVGGNLIGNARWLGLPIGPLLTQAGLSPDADMVLSTSADGFTCSTPLSVLTDGRDALLAIGMNGQALPLEHGFPVRMVVPGLYGYVSATKWVVDLEVTRFDRAQGYWTSRGWSPMAPVKTESRIDVPSDGSSVKVGQVAVAGIAWAQHRGITGVQVRVDNGPWQDARLGAEVSVDTWRQWVFAWDATHGNHTLAVRAIDNTGQPQTGIDAPPPPDGATGWHTIAVNVG